LNTAGYVFILVGLVLVRQVAVGRATDIVADIRDLSLAFLQGDMNRVGEVLSQRGENTPVGPSEVATGPTGVSGGNSAYAQAVVSLGNAAKGYRLGATGPDYYDCSGLLWKAATQLGYKGARFTTATFQHAVADSKGFFTPVAGPPKTGDIILWDNHGHMGVSLGGDVMYSARNQAKGINKSTVSGDSGAFGEQPTFYSVVTG